MTDDLDRLVRQSGEHLSGGQSLLVEVVRHMMQQSREESREVVATLQALAQESRQGREAHAATLTALAAEVRAVAGAVVSLTEEVGRQSEGIARVVTAMEAHDEQIRDSLATFTAHSATLANLDTGALNDAIRAAQTPATWPAAAAATVGKVGAVGLLVLVLIAALIAVVWLALARPAAPSLPASGEAIEWTGDPAWHRAAVSEPEPAAWLD